VLAVILGDLFGENLAAAVPRVRAVNVGGGDEYDLTDAGGSGRFENFEGAAHIEIEKIVNVLLAAILVDAVPGGDVDDTVAARNISANFERSRMDPSMNKTPSFKLGGARTSRMTGVSPFSSSLGTRACPRFPDPPVSSTLMAFSGPLGKS
jgi:hypothetical protein